MTHVPALVIKVGAIRFKNRPAQDLIEVVETPTGTRESNDSYELELNNDADPFASLMIDPPPDGIVLKCGEALFGALESMPRFTKLAFGGAQQLTPVYFKLETAGSENLPWEALWHRSLQRYLALDPKWPIGRLAPGSAEPQPPSPIEPTLKILLVLGAARGSGRPVDASGEWQGIRNALNKPQHANKLRVHVLYCQEEIGAQIAALEDPALQVTAEPLLAASTFERALVDLAPNIVHFFCHGSADGEARLNLATLGDYDAELPEGSLWLGLNELLPLSRMRSVWLVTLNCCQGARASASGRSLAASLMQEGLPAVVAMRHSVDYVKAGMFSSAFYEHLIGALVPMLPSEQQALQGGTMTISETVWLDAMHPPRRVLSQSRVDGDPTWTLPVVYVQRGGLTLRHQPRSGTLINLLPPEQQTAIAGKRAEGKALAELEAQQRQLASVPVAVLEQLASLSRDAMQQAHRLERDALVAHLQQAGLAPGARDTLQRRIDELQRSLG